LKRNEKIIGESNKKRKILYIQNKNAKTSNSTKTDKKREIFYKSSKPKGKKRYFFRKTD